MALCHPSFPGLAPAQTWYAQHRVVPINHMVVVTESLARARPELVAEIYRLLAQGKKAAGLPKPGTPSISFRSGSKPAARD